MGDLFGEFWGGDIPVEPSPDVWHYRNKVDFNFALKRYPELPPEGFVRESVLGFRARGRWYCPLDIGECLIGPAGNGPLLHSVRDWMRAQGLRGFDSRSKQGFLKALLLREGKRTGERMVVLITGEGSFHKESFVQAVLGAYPATSVYHGVLRRPSDVAAADEMELLHGTPTIDECLHIPGADGHRKLRFHLSPFSFFQTNTLATEKLYGAIRSWVRESPPRMLYDLYGGMGGIALSCADLVQFAWSVENVESASRDGVHNAKTNGVENVGFLTLKVKNYLKTLLEEGPLESGCAAIADPPRSGMTPKALRRLIELRPERILYVACKPSVFVKELPLFLTEYALTRMTAIDLFPHTEHVEVLASLSLR